MFIDDCLKGIDLIMNSEILEPINLGSSEAVTINQLVNLAEEIGRNQLKAQLRPQRAKGVNGRNSDKHSHPKYLSWEPSTSLRTGSKKTYRWIYDRTGSRGVRTGVAREAAAVTDKL